MLFPYLSVDGKQPVFNFISMWYHSGYFMQIEETEEENQQAAGSNEEKVGVSDYWLYRW